MGMPLQDPQGGAAHAPSKFAAYSGRARRGGSSEDNSKVMRSE